MLLSIFSFLFLTQCPLAALRVPPLSGLSVPAFSYSLPFSLYMPLSHWNSKCQSENIRRVRSHAPQLLPRRCGACSLVFLLLFKFRHQEMKRTRRSVRSSGSVVQRHSKSTYVWLLNCCLLYCFTILLPSFLSCFSCLRQGCTGCWRIFFTRTTPRAFQKKKNNNKYTPAASVLAALFFFSLCTPYAHRRCWSLFSNFSPFTA